ncbi:MAG: response regulator [Nannocystaceae bacterium]
MNQPAHDADSDDLQETILLVDDDKVFCGALAGALRRRSFRVVVAHDADEAIAEANAWHPERALVDLRMPGKSGLEVVSALRAISPELRIIVLTGYGSIATAVEAIKLGAVHYLTKPASVDEILAAFERTDAVTEVEAPTAPRPLDEVEWEHLQKVLTDCGGNISEAARRLGMHRRSLQRKLARGRPET